MEYQDYYKTLDVPRTATAAEIKKAYRKLAQKHHPDLNKDKGSENKFKVINEAYEVLKDPEKRKRYDALGANWKDGERFRPPPGAEDIFGSFMGGQQGFGRGGFQSTSDGPGGFSDFFEALFGGANPFGGKAAGAGATRTRQRKGQSKRAALTVTLEELYNGTTKKIQIETLAPTQSGVHDKSVKNYDIKIPATVKDGGTIRLAGLGEPGIGGGANGDLLITVTIAKHPRYKIQDQDLVVSLPISPWEAAFGGKIPLDLFGSKISLNIPAGSQSGQRLRLKGKGLAKDKTTRGDLLVELKITLPKELTEKEKELLQELAKVSTFDPRG